MQITAMVLCVYVNCILQTLTMGETKIASLSGLGLNLIEMKEHHKII